MAPLWKPRIQNQTVSPNFPFSYSRGKTNHQLYFSLCHSKLPWGGKNTEEWDGIAAAFTTVNVCACVHSYVRGYVRAWVRACARALCWGVHHTVEPNSRVHHKRAGEIMTDKTRAEGAEVCQAKFNVGVPGGNAGLKWCCHKSELHLPHLTAYPPV